MKHNLKVISWNITRKCNLQCLHCYLPANYRTEGMSACEDTNELSTEKALKVIDEIARANNEVMLILSGGEPLMREDIYKLAEYASSKGMMVVIGTNGLLLNENRIERLKKSGVTGVSISLDSVNREIHDSFRLTDGAWDKAVEAITLCKANGLSVQINTVVTKRNYREMPELIDYAYYLKANVFSPFFLVCTGRGEKLSDISPEEYEQVLTQVVESQKKHKGMMIRTRCAPTFRRILHQKNPDSNLLKLDAGKCMAGTSYCRITPEGTVTPCPYMQVCAGNLRHNSFDRIWESAETFKQLRTPQLKGKCSKCEYRLLCGGCRARAHSMYSDLMQEDYWCIHKPADTSAIEPPTFAAMEASTNDSDIKLQWSNDAELRLKKVPFFVRSMVRGAVERYAVQHNYKEITPHVMAEARKKSGMGRMVKS